MNSQQLVHEAVPLLHATWQRRVETWPDMVHDLNNLPAQQATVVIRSLADELTNHLLPYIELEEQVRDDADLFDPIGELEHATIRRTIERVQEFADVGDEADIARSQAVLALLADLLVDHLRHERDTYLPVL